MAARGGRQRQYWLASDDAATVERLVNRYPNIHTFHNRLYGRDTRQSLIQAGIDIIILSKADVIYASPGSSFSLTAAAIGNSRHMICPVRNNVNIDYWIRNCRTVGRVLCEVIK